jgi:hypothetical protein
MSLPLRALAPLCLTALLCACGPSRNQFAPSCPTPKLIPPLADVTSYNNPGPAHDITNLVFHARIMSINGSCKAGDKPDELAGSVQIGVAIQRGPAMVGRSIEVPIFLAITIGETVRDKQIFPVVMVFPSNVDQLNLVSPPIDLALPIGGGVTGASYTIIAGFQAPPDEFTANQSSPPPR